MADSPDIRIGTAERETAMRRLSDHFAAGRLSVAEFDERSAVVAGAVTHGDLVGVFADLPEPATQPQQSASSSPRQRRAGRAEVRGAAMGLTVIVALVLFFVLHTWLWFLLIPAAAILLGPSGRRDQGQRRREERRERRDRRRGR
ncbi:DUF1707 SHOCT-like domain-containing protein [Nocardia miyunensis]|uniref:DUF1707 SHOCT-like domain-containing protein n=1 Tax=Nocardia miyunensis TaxID=282684 RepID=UPI000833B550|nr:DUF1707 domain-containing protein [Nocardia miyunensis]